jgi:hypothetical protein
VGAVRHAEHNWDPLGLIATLASGNREGHVRILRAAVFESVAEGIFKDHLACNGVKFGPHGAELLEQ